LFVLHRDTERSLGVAVLFQKLTHGCSSTRVLGRVNVGFGEWR
jgi:hypothetical protein